ncbi:two-component system, sensor histidine kinase YesM [Paenibacillus sp. yr247]|uniref:cache domain-containing sensor histidine kinase n=1 Tax=Paenibacillus sp. yr247 TaxID=1761880 RepID=UPI000886EBD1|nr:sensor histidine kinase [Paenibacillus sp. yr247]SDM83006.1 two-component system, sensor histidine kinase YesM [Paenibacillus sp. yr247]
MIRTHRFTNRFAVKMIMAFLIVSLIPIIFASVSFYMESTSIVKKNVRESTIQLAKQTADSLSFIFNVGSDTSDYIYSDPKIQNTALRMSSSPPDEQNRMNQYMSTMLNNIVYSNSFVKIVYVMKEDGSGWGSGAFSVNKLRRVNLAEEAWVKEAKAKDGELVWQGLQYDRFSGAGDNTDLILPVGRVLKDFQSLKNIGLVMVNLNGRSILNTIKQLKLGETGTFFVVDGEGKIMIDSNLRLIDKKVQEPELLEHIVGNDAAEFEFTLNGLAYYGVKQYLNNGWMIVGTVPVREITGQLDRLQASIFLSSGLFALLAISIGLFIANWVINPIKRLTRDMRKVQQGDLKVRTDIESSDEIGLLSKQFNKMLQEIERLMDRVEEEQQQKLQAEVRAVMHRIHPHFLYNTLSTLRWLIKSNQNERADKGLSALTRLMEANMGKRGNMITIVEELDIIRKYLVILELRYEKRFVLEVQLDPGAESIVIPRMLLQPLVENAIFHGIVPKQTDGLITISVRVRDETAELIISDDGLGIPEERIEELNDLKTAIEKDTIGIGLRHVYDTLSLQYTGRAEFTIESTLQKGTTIRILLRKPEGLKGQFEKQGGD